VILARGTVAAGAAGKAASGEQLILLLPRGETVRAAITGRNGVIDRRITFDGETVTVTDR
jgi:3-hydroxyisobutyrate dehydrogenase-like beta-hydroxyacid dehydrogenase